MHYAVHFALFYALHYVLLYTVQYAIHFALLTERTTALWAVYGHLFITTKLSRQTTTWRWRSQETMGNKVFELSTKNIMLLDMWTAYTPSPLPRAVSRAKSTKKDLEWHFWRRGFPRRVGRRTVAAPASCTWCWCWCTFYLLCFPSFFMLMLMHRPSTLLSNFLYLFYWCWCIFHIICFASFFVSF